MEDLENFLKNDKCSSVIIPYVCAVVDEVPFFVPTITATEAVFTILLSKQIHAQSQR